MQVLPVAIAATPFFEWRPALPTNSLPSLSTAISEQPTPQQAS